MSKRTATFRIGQYAQAPSNGKLSGLCYVERTLTEVVALAENHAGANEIKLAMEALEEKRTS